MKRWVDASEIKMIHELEDSKLRELDIEMRKKPKFDKRGERGCCKNGESEKTFKTNKRYKESI